MIKEFYFKIKSQKSPGESVGTRSPIFSPPSCTLGVPTFCYSSKIELDLLSFLNRPLCISRLKGPFNVGVYSPFTYISLETWRGVVSHRGSDYPTILLFFTFEDFTMSQVILVSATYCDWVTGHIDSLSHYSLLPIVSSLLIRVIWVSSYPPSGHSIHSFVDDKGGLFGVSSHLSCETICTTDISRPPTTTGTWLVSGSDCRHLWVLDVSMSSGS